MKRLIAVLFLVLGLVGCRADYSDETYRWKLPPELKGYRVMTLSSKNGNYIYVLVKNGVEDREVIGTTVPGKVPRHTVVIDGEAYGKLEK
jgi:hypothetical protein